MKLIVLRGNLKEGMAALERTVIDNPNLPILKNIIIKADARITLQATNLEVGVTFLTNAKISEPGAVCVPFAPLNNIIQNSLSERISISTNENTLTITTDNYEAKIQGVPAEDFPIIPKLETDKRSLELSVDVFKQAIGQVAIAAATNDLKPELNSVLVDVHSGTLKFAATDGFRLAEKTLSTNAFAVSGEPIKALIPLKTIHEVVRTFPAGSQLKIQFDDNQALFNAKDVSLITRLIDGNYPEYTQIIPKQTPIEFTVEREQFLQAVKLVSNFSGKTNDVKIKTADEKKSLAIFASSQLVGENTYHVPLKKHKGESTAPVVFNWRYLADGVRALSGSAITLGITNESKPTIIRPTDDTSVFYIVMPIQQ